MISCCVPFFEQDLNKLEEKSAEYLTSQQNQSSNLQGIIEKLEELTVQTNEVTSNIDSNSSVVRYKEGLRQVNLEIQDISLRVGLLEWDLLRRKVQEGEYNRRQRMLKRPKAMKKKYGKHKSTVGVGGGGGGAVDEGEDSLDRLA